MLRMASGPTLRVFSVQNNFSDQNNCFKVIKKAALLAKGAQPKMSFFDEQKLFWLYEYIYSCSFDSGLVFCVLQQYI